MTPQTCLPYGELVEKPIHRKNAPPPAAAPRPYPAYFPSRPACMDCDDGRRGESLVSAGVLDQPGDRPGALRIGGRLARCVLPRREDRLHGQPDADERRRIRAR